MRRPVGPAGGARWGASSHGGAMPEQRECKLKDVAAELNCSVEHARRIERRALEKLRREFQARGYDAEFIQEHLSERSVPTNPTDE